MTLKYRRIAWISVLVAGATWLTLCDRAIAAVRRTKFNTINQYLIVEALDDDLIHFEVGKGMGPSINTPIYTSPMVNKKNYLGPSFFLQSGNTLETKDMRIQIDAQSLCIAVTDKIRNQVLSTICPLNVERDWKGLTLSKQSMQNVYGLGQQFRKLGTADGDWIEHSVREEQPPGQKQEFGNGFMPFGSAGMVGNVQFPVLYAVGANNLNYAFFLDNVYKQRWEFNGIPWKVQMWGDQIRFYIMTGPNLPDLRKDYLELVGRPPVPPKKALGLWVSEFGYKNWDQINTIKTGLRQDNFPVDGFVLDLQWFGGIKDQSPDSPMGRLNWDVDSNDGNNYYFPNPSGSISNLSKDGVGLVAIEESYISKNTDTYQKMKDAGNLFAYSRTNNICDLNVQSTPIILKEWFGQSGMVDWSDPKAGHWIHQNRRLPNLAQNGILGHWTDLGEPEKYDGSACYDGVETTSSGPKNQHGDVHNLYNFLWNQSIYNGYVNNISNVRRRPFIVSRSGAPGSQRFGVAMWSGDIGSNLDLLATHLNSQMHMSFSGIDYYGSDVGGFRREGMPYNESHQHLQYQTELYTQWFANGAWFDVPLRPHTDNSFQDKQRYETAPNLVGSKQSNLANLQQRYELTPYYYSLAYRSHLFGEPLIPPLVFYYQNDPVVRTIGHEKLIGKDLLVGVVTQHGEFKRDIYLPPGKWINYHTNEWFNSNGSWLKAFPTYLDSTFRLPAFAKAGAILPMMSVDEQTKNTLGERKDNSLSNALVLRVYASPNTSEFTLYEDDGSTLTFNNKNEPLYQTRTTLLSQAQVGQNVNVTVNGSRGTYPGAVDQRDTLVQLVVENASASTVRMSGTTLPQHPTLDAFNRSDRGWFNAGGNRILAKSGVLPVTAAKIFQFTIQSQTPTASVHFVCDNGWTNPGESIYVVGNHSKLGNWQPEKALALSPNVYYEYIYNPPPGHNGPGPSTPKWTGLIQGLPTNMTLEWKCVKKLTSGQWQFESGANNQITTTNAGFSGTSMGAF